MYNKPYITQLKKFRFICMHIQIFPDQITITSLNLMYWCIINLGVEDYNNYNCVHLKMFYLKVSYYSVILKM